jgi:hypothetical protein
MDDLTANWLTGGFNVSYQMGLACFAGVAWAIWLTRNKMCMSHIFPNNCIDAIYTCLSFMQKWRILAGESARCKMDGFLEVVLRKVQEFRPSKYMLSDVEYL